MFTSPAPAPTSSGLRSQSRTATVSTSPVPTSTSISTPTSRSSRLRGLNYLRTYTQNHILNREHSQSSLSPVSPNSDFQSSPRATTHPNQLTRSVSTPITASFRETAPAPSARGTSIVDRHADRSDAVQLSMNLPNRSINTRESSAPVARGAAAVVVISSTAEQPSTRLDGGGGNMTRTRSATDSGVGKDGNPEILPSIRFSTFYDPRAVRPSLTFSPVSRTLPSGHEVIRVGRYSERDSQPAVPMNVPSSAPVGFKSKVVSRRHCEFWYEAGKWYIKDVKSSSGTFLNHIRLSPPGTESRPYTLNDGDIVQLGIDFKGGEEMIFRCVKMRVELNRGWQNKLNTFNMTTHKRLRNMTRTSETGASTQSSQDCSICLNSIAPCQSLFVAPCSHTWHFKCIRALLNTPQYPIFICPNCRAAADLEAEVEDLEEWEQLGSDDGLEADNKEAKTTDGPARKESADAQPAATTHAQAEPSSRRGLDDADLLQADSECNDDPTSSPQAEENDLDSPRPQSPLISLSHATSDPVPIPIPMSNGVAIRLAAEDTGASTPTTERQTRTPSPDGTNPPLPIGNEGPITPRNDAGPWVFDGSGIRPRAAGRTSTDSRRGEMRSLDHAAVEAARQQA